MSAPDPRSSPSILDAPATAEDLIAFFRALSPDARAAYRALAELDRRFGEDVAGERSARTTEAKERP
jgi:hypothetical protein